MKLNALKPSVREKKRYICFKIDNKTSSKDASDILLTRVKKWMGEKYFAIGRVYFMHKFYQDGKGIISCNHKQLADVKSGLLLVDKLKVDIFYVSGSLKKAREKLKDYI